MAPWVRVWGWASCRLFSFIFFFFFLFLCLPFGFSSYIVHLRCISEGWWSPCFTRPLIRSFALPCCCRLKMGCIVYTDYVYPAFDPLFADISCLLFLYRKWGCCCFLFAVPFSFFFSLLFFLTMCSFVFYWSFHTRLIACLIRAALLLLSFCLPLFISRCFVIGSSD